MNRNSHAPDWNKVVAEVLVLFRSEQKNAFRRQFVWFVPSLFAFYTFHLPIALAMLLAGINDDALFAKVLLRFHLEKMNVFRGQLYWFVPSLFTFYTLYLPIALAMLLAGINDEALFAKVLLRFHLEKMNVFRGQLYWFIPSLFTFYTFHLPIALAMLLAGINDEALFAKVCILFHLLNTHLKEILV